MRLKALLFGLTCLTQVGVASAVDIDLGGYSRVGRYNLPTPANSAAPANSLLAQEASGLTYDGDTDSLFVIGDGGTSIVQVSKTGQLIDSMTLALGNSPQGTEFYDTEAIGYAGNGQFVFTEERYRQVNLVTYAAGTTLTRAGVKTVKLGTTIGNVGLEGITVDPVTGGYILGKEKTPEGLFQTTIDFNAGTASNGSATTVNSVNLFDPALLGLLDISDVYSLANVAGISAADRSNLLVLSQESGRLVETDRSGHILSSLDLTSIVNSGEASSVPAFTFEGVTVDSRGTIYLTTEAGGGTGVSQLFVLAPNAAAAVPEPASWALLVSGFGAVGGALRRRAPSPERPAQA